jgi:hypothetical protein
MQFDERLPTEKLATMHDSGVFLFLRKILDVTLIHSRRFHSLTPYNTILSSYQACFNGLFTEVRGGDNFYAANLIFRT